MSGIYEEEYKCKVCKKRYSSVDKLKEHYNDRHLSKKKHQCNTCNYSSDKRSDVTRHQNSRHKTDDSKRSAEMETRETPGPSGATSPVPPKVQRMLPKRNDPDGDWPTLEFILGSEKPAEEGDTGEVATAKANLPPTPYVTPVSGGKTQPSEETRSDTRRVVERRTCTCCGEEGVLTEKIVTEVYRDGRVTVTVRRYNGETDGAVPGGLASEERSAGAAEGPRRQIFK